MAAALVRTVNINAVLLPRTFYLRSNIVDAKADSGELNWLGRLSYIIILKKSFENLIFLYSSHEQLLEDIHALSGIASLIYYIS